MKNSITIICGHYGCGKTNLALNLSVEASQNNKKVVLVDMDIVNPYFRACEYSSLLIENNIELIAPSMSDTTLDTPSLSAKVYSAFVDDGKEVIIDLGGDDVGATALGVFRDKIKDYQMIYVINKNRLQSNDCTGALELLREIEQTSRLKATAIVNNTHLGVETTKETILEAVDFAKEFAEMTNLPLLYSTAPSFCETEGFKTVQRYVKFMWEN